MKQLMKYEFKQIIRDTSVMFWALLFPILLGTMFYFSFGNGYEATQMKAINVALVKEKETEYSKAFEGFLENLDKSTVAVKKISKKEAQKALLEGKVSGIYYIGEKQRLEVASSGLQESILESLLDSYNKNAAMISKIIKEHPENIEKALESLTEYKKMTKEVSLGGRTLDTYIQYFFALIAMACLYGCFLGLKSALEIQANLSELGARRSVTPTSKSKIVISSLLVIWGIHFTNIMILLIYLKYILKLDFGDQLGKMIIICLVGSLLGISYGMLIGNIGKGSENTKTGILVGVSMVLSFFAGLMTPDIKNIVEQIAPIMNKINPAVLISDGFYALGVYDDPERYYRNIVSLLVMSGICVAANIIIMRREQYDSI